MTPSMEAIHATTKRFRALFEAELDFVVATLRRLGVAPRDLEDVAHEVFLRVHAHFDTYDAARPPRPWLFVFTLRQASDYRRLARHRREVLDDRDDDGPGAATSSSPAADDRIDERERRALIEAALLEVDFDRRVVLLLHDLQETPMTEVAGMLEIPLQTAYSRLRVGREELIRAARRMRLRERGAP